MLIELGKIIDEHRENFHKELGNIKRNQPELKNNIPEVKNTSEGTDSRGDDIKECISDPEDRKKGN